MDVDKNDYFVPEPALQALSASLNAAATLVDARTKVPAQMIDVAPIASASLTAIGASCTALSIEVHEASASASAIDIDAVTVETTPVPRVDIDLVDAPTSLDPVSGMIDDIAVTGRFERRLEAPHMTDVSRALEVRVPAPLPSAPKLGSVSTKLRIAIASGVLLAAAAGLLVAASAC